MEKKFIFVIAIILIASFNVFSQNADFSTFNTSVYIPTVNTDLLLTSGVWATLPTSPHAVSRSCCTYIKRGDTAYLYQFGGGSAAQLTNVAVFNFVTNQWTNNVTTLPFQMSAAGSVAWGDSVIFIFGGNSPTLGKALKYNIVTNTFTTLPDMPSPVTDALVVMWRDSVVYVVAGGDGLFGTTVSNVVRRYSINTNSWTTVTSLPESKSMLGGGIYKDTIYAIAGWTGSTGTATSHKGVINPATGDITWTTFAPYPTGGVTRMGSYMCLKPEQGVGILCTGGAIAGATLTAATNFWNICTQQWQTLPNNSLARSNFRGTGTNDSIFYCVGGYTTAGVGTFERFTFSFITGTCAIVTGIGNNNLTVDNYSLSQNYPNPFNPVTKITFTIPKSSNVTLTITDILGREVAVLVNDFRQAGEYRIDFDATGYTSGIYFYTLKAGEFSKTMKMVLMK